MKLKLTKQARKPRFKNRRLFKQILQHAVLETGLDNTGAVNTGELHVVLVGPRKMRRLNRTFLGHDRVTDVIAFDLTPEAEQLWTGEADVIGEIYVCPAVAEEAAARFGTTAADETILYAVHGMLHLRGEDDLTPAAKRQMRNHEKRVMGTLQRMFPDRDLFVREDLDR